MNLFFYLYSDIPMLMIYFSIKMPMFLELGIYFRKMCQSCRAKRDTFKNMSHDLEVK